MMTPIEALAFIIGLFVVACIGGVVGYDIGWRSALQKVNDDIAKLEDAEEARK